MVLFFFIFCFSPLIYYLFVVFFYMVYDVWSKITDDWLITYYLTIDISKLLVSFWMANVICYAYVVLISSISAVNVSNDSIDRVWLLSV